MDPTGSLQPATEGGDAWSRALWLGVAAWVCALFFAAPSLHDFESDRLLRGRAGDYVRMCADPLTTEIREQFLHYRILPPLIVKALGGGKTVALALPPLAAALTLGLVYLAFWRRFDGRIAWLATLMTATTSAVSWTNGMPGYPDSVAHLCLAALLLTRRSGWWAALVLAGILADERLLLGLPFILWWHGPDTDRRDLCGMWAGAAVGVLAAVIARISLQRGWWGPGFSQPTLYPAMLRSLLSGRPWVGDWWTWWANVAGAFRWAWWIIAAGGWVAFKAGRKIQALLFAASVAVATGLSFVIFDITRSVGFVFPALLLGLAWLVRSDAASAARRLRLTVWACFLTPSYWIASAGLFWWWRPLVLRLLAYYTGHDPLDGWN